MPLLFFLSLLTIDNPDQKRKPIDLVLLDEVSDKARLRLLKLSELLLLRRTVFFPLKVSLCLSKPFPKLFIPSPDKIPKFAAPRSTEFFHTLYNVLH